MTDHRTRAAKLVRDIAELPDRSSPEDWPEALLVTADELIPMLVAAFEEVAMAASPPRSLPTRVEKSVGETLARNV